MLCSFLVLFILFVIAIEMNQRHRINTAETIFMVYALGFTLEKLACMQEHGIKGKSSYLLLLPIPLISHSLLQGDLGEPCGTRPEIMEDV